MDPKIERINGEVKVWCAIPETDQIKINGDMYGPINTPHPISVKEVKLMLFYGKDVKAVEPGATKEEIKAADVLTLDVLEDAEELFLMEEIEDEEPEDKEPSVGMGAPVTLAAAPASTAKTKTTTTVSKETE